MLRSVGTRIGFVPVPLLAKLGRPVAPCASRQLPAKLNPEWQCAQPTVSEKNSAMPRFASGESAACSPLKT